MYGPAGSCMHDPEHGRTCAAMPVGARADWNSKYVWLRSQSGVALFL